MRSLLAAAAVLTLLAGCSDDDDAPTAAAVTTTTTEATTSSSTTLDEDCAGADPVPPTTPSGEAAELVAETDDLAFAIVDRGASVEIVSVSEVVECAYRTVELDGRPATFPVGGSVTHGDGIRCTDDGITVLSATSDDGATYQATAVDYEVDDGELVETDRRASTIEAGEDPGELDGYYRLDC